MGRGGSEERLGRKRGFPSMQRGGIAVTPPPPPPPKAQNRGLLADKATRPDVSSCRPNNASAAPATVVTVRA